MRVRAEPGQVFYRHAGPAGPAPAIVHVHGFAISGSYMLPTASLLTDTFHNYVPDLPGYGRTPHPGRPLSIRGLADTLVAFLDSLGLERATFVGNSMGCPVIGRMLQGHPDRVDRAVLVSPAGGLHNRPLARAVGQLALDGLREPPSLLTVAGPDYLRFGMINAVRLFVEMTQSPTVAMLEQIDLPVLLVAGSRDPLLPPMSRLERLAASLRDQPNIQLVWMEGPAHAINFSHPVELAAVIRGYMSPGGVSDLTEMPSGVRVMGAG